MIFGIYLKVLCLPRSFQNPLECATAPATNHVGSFWNVVQQELPNRSKQALIFHL